MPAYAKPLVYSVCDAELGRCANLAAYAEKSQFKYKGRIRRSSRSRSTTICNGLPLEEEYCWLSYP